MAIGTGRSARFRRAMEGLVIRDKAGVLKPLSFMPSQEILWHYIAPQLDTRGKLWFIVLKSRQIGATTLFCALTFLRSIEKPLTNSLIIANELHSAADIFGITRRFWEHLPLPKLRDPRVKELDFPFPEGSSRLRVVSAGNIAKGRGTTQTCVHATEVAFWPQPEVIIGLFQAMPNLDDTLWVLESTANGIVGNGNMFYEQWKAAMDGRSDLTPIFIPWFSMPEYRMDPALDESEWDDEEKELVKQFGEFGLTGRSLAWRRYMIATKTQGSVEYFRQEYPASPHEAFISTGLPAFERLAVLAQEGTIRVPLATGQMIDRAGTGEKVRPDFEANPRGWLKIWRAPEDGHQYAIGVDTSEGVKGGDYACAQIIDMGTMEQVGILHGMLSPWDMAYQLNLLGRWYRNAVLAIELAGTGRAVQDYLVRIFSYPNLHVWLGRQDAIRQGQAKTYGWATNVWSRPLLIEAGRRAINTRLVTIHDRSTLDEIQNFSRSDTGKYEAQHGHDDRVLALLIGLRSREENYSPARKLLVESEFSLAPGSISPGGIRVVHSLGTRMAERVKLHKLLTTQAQKATKGWMEL